MERKEFDAIVTDIDADQGIVKAIFAVMGNVEGGGDMIHPGAFTKTFAERGNQIMVLDNHRTDSVMSILGKPLGLKELGFGSLPAPLVDAYPDANGAAEAEIQFLLDTPEGAGAFKRIKGGALSKWSFGYEAMDHDYSTVKAGDGAEQTVRNLRTIKLFELSPVLFAMNEATMTTGYKGDEPEADAVPEPEVEPETVKAFSLIIDGVELELEDEQKAAITELITAPAPQAAIETEPEQAGPDADEATPPTSTLSIAELEMTLTKLHLLEVGHDYISREV